MTPLECLLKADECEQRSRSSKDGISRCMLLRTAEHWRTLARTASATPSEEETSGRVEAPKVHDDHAGT